MNLETIKQAHTLLKEQKYEWHPIEKGYNNRTLYVNLDDNRIEAGISMNGKYWSSTESSATKAKCLDTNSSLPTKECYDVDKGKAEAHQVICIRAF